MDWKSDGTRRRSSPGADRWNRGVEEKSRAKPFRFGTRRRYNNYNNSTDKNIFVFRVYNNNFRHVRNPVISPLCVVNETASVPQLCRAPRNSVCIKLLFSLYQPSSDTIIIIIHITGIGHLSAK